MKKKLTLEEMIVNAIMNQGKKFRNVEWSFCEYIYWENNKMSAGFKDEMDSYVDFIDIDHLLDGWEDFNEDGN